MKFRQIVRLILLASLAFTTYSCTVAAGKGEFYGSTTPPAQNIFRYVNGDEPSYSILILVTANLKLDFSWRSEGLVEYHPKTVAPIPALAEDWDINSDASEFTFHLRRNGRWSNGDPIDANDFVYSFGAPSRKGRFA